MTFERKSRTDGSISPISEESLRKKLEGYVHNIDDAIQMMQQNMFDWIITTGFADYRAVEQETQCPKLK